MTVYVCFYLWSFGWSPGSLTWQARALPLSYISSPHHWITKGKYLLMERMLKSLATILYNHGLWVLDRWVLSTGILPLPSWNYHFPDYQGKVTLKSMNINYSREIEFTSFCLFYYCYLLYLIRFNCEKEYHVGMVAHAFNLSIWEANPGGFL